MTQACAQPPSAADDPTEQANSGSGAIWHPCPPRPDCPHCSNPDAPPLLDWGFLDAVFCISLKIRDDRAMRAAEEFHRAGLCRYVEFYRPEKHPERGVIGSWESHRQVAMEAQRRGCRNALVFEDDVKFLRRITPRRLEKVRRTLARLPDDWRVFYLGHWPVEAWFLGRNLLKTRSGCAHAYIISPRLMQWIREHPYGRPGTPMTKIVGKNLDAAFAELPGTYALMPMLATQSVSASDNFSFKPRQKKKLKHWVTRSRYREALLSHLMQPAELIVTLLSPFFWLRHKYRTRRRAAP
jgi:GR25 family glycosyltransferase involved in LPS biosynthesis